MREVVEEKDATIDKLQDDIQNIAEAYNNMLAQYMAKLNEYSFPVDDLGFKPVTLRTKQTFMQSTTQLQPEGEEGYEDQM